MIKPIVQKHHPALRQVSDYVDVAKIKSIEIKNLLSDMRDSLSTQKDGVALAAPQLGFNKQIFIVAPFIFKNPKHEHLVYINPEIINKSGDPEWKSEGCLSCRWKIGNVKRSSTVTITAYDEQGNKFEETSDKLLAQIFQHETDHLHGILFIDKARDLRDMTKEEIEDAQK